MTLLFWIYCHINKLFEKSKQIFVLYCIFRENWIEQKQFSSCRKSILEKLHRTNEKRLGFRYRGWMNDCPGKNMWQVTRDVYICPCLYIIHGGAQQAERLSLSNTIKYLLAVFLSVASAGSSIVALLFFTSENKLENKHSNNLQNKHAQQLVPKDLGLLRLEVLRLGPSNFIPFTLLCSNSYILLLLYFITIHLLFFITI